MHDIWSSNAPRAIFQNKAESFNLRFALPLVLLCGRKNRDQPEQLPHNLNNFFSSFDSPNRKGIYSKPIHLVSNSLASFESAKKYWNFMSAKDFFTIVFVLRKNPSRNFSACWMTICLWCMLRTFTLIFLKLATSLQIMPSIFSSNFSSKS